MAAIDSLLRVMFLRDAEAMVVTTGQAPSLRRGGNAEPMAMPALDAAMVASFVADVVPPDSRAELETRRSGEYAYQSAAGDAVSVNIELTAAGHRLVVRRAAGKAARPPSASPPPVPPPTPPPSPGAAARGAAALAAAVASAPPPSGLPLQPLAPLGPSGIVRTT